MFYVSGSKIYLAIFDAKLKVYPEVKVVRDEHDRLGVLKTGGGVAQKPAVYSLCTLTELLAQYGGTVQAKAEMPADTGGDKASAKK